MAAAATSPRSINVLLWPDTSVAQTDGEKNTATHTYDVWRASQPHVKQKLKDYIRAHYNQANRMPDRCAHSMPERRPAWELLVFAATILDSLYRKRAGAITRTEVGRTS